MSSKPPSRISFRHIQNIYQPSVSATGAPSVMCQRWMMNLRSDLRAMIRRWRPKLRGQGPTLAGCLKLDHMNKWIRTRIMMMMIIVVMIIITIILLLLLLLLLLFLLLLLIIMMMMMMSSISCLVYRIPHYDHQPSWDKPWGAMPPQNKSCAPCNMVTNHIPVLSYIHNPPVNLAFFHDFSWVLPSSPKKTPGLPPKKSCSQAGYSAPDPRYLLQVQEGPVEIAGELIAVVQDDLAPHDVNGLSADQVLETGTGPMSRKSGEIKGAFSLLLLLLLPL